MSASILSMGPLTIGSTTIGTRITGLDPAIVEALQLHSGLPYPTANLVSGANPKFTFECYFQDIVALIPGSFTILSATTFSLYMSLYSSYTRDATSVHTKIALQTSPTCYAAVQMLSTRVAQDGTLMAECQAEILGGDSTTYPLVTTSNNTLPALSAEPIKHTLGPCVINSTGVPGVMDAAFNLNPTNETKRSDGDLYPKVTAQLQGQPRLILSHGDPKGVLAALGLLGTNVTANVVQYFRRYDGTTGVAGAANGISLTIASGRAIPVVISNEQGRISTTGIEVSALSSSTTYPVAISLTATVPAA